MTFEEFVATKTEVTDEKEIARIEAENYACGVEYEIMPLMYLMYEDGLTIEKYEIEYRLIIGASDWYSDELHELEKRLYEFYLTEY